MRAIHGATADVSVQLPPREELFMVVFERVDKEIASDMLIAAIEVLERNGFAGSVHRTESGGVLLSGRKESSSDAP